MTYLHRLSEQSQKTGSTLSGRGKSPVLPRGSEKWKTWSFTSLWDQESADQPVIPSGSFWALRQGGQLSGCRAPRREERRGFISS